MRTATILTELKKYLANEKTKINRNLAMQLETLTEADIIEKSAPEIIVCKFDYNCTGMGEKFGNHSIKFPLTKTYTSDACYFYRGAKDAAEKEMREFWGKDEEYPIYDIDDIDEAIKSDAFWKLRDDFRMYDCRTYPDWIKINNYHEHKLSQRTGKYSPIYAKLDRTSNNTELLLLGYTIFDDNEEEEIIMFEIGNDSKSIKSGNFAGITMWGCLAIGLGIFFPPVLIAYILYLAWKKKKL